MWRGVEPLLLVKFGEHPPSFSSTEITSRWPYLECTEPTRVILNIQRYISMSSTTMVTKVPPAYLITTPFYQVGERHSRKGEHIKNI